MIIKEVFARQIKDSRGKKTIEVSINGQKASSPSGTSAGTYETKSFHNSIQWNIKAINSFKELKNLEIESFADLHIVEDLIKSKFKLKDAKQFGANALFALESAILKALAKSKNKQLWQIINPNARRFPVPLGNAVGGGLHAKLKDAPTFQEFLLIPQGSSFSQNVRIMNSVYKQLKSKLKANSIDQEGAWQCSLNEIDVLKIISKFKQIKIGIDVAASSFYNKGNYCYKNRCLNRAAQIEFINELISTFNIFYFEDPLEENDFSGFSKINKKNLICGDDLTVTHLERLKKAIKNKSINSVIIKPNQNGSLLELKQIFDFCKKSKIKTILSHRAGETLDSALADYAFAFQADFIKCGIATKWRQAKLNRMIEIENS